MKKALLFILCIVFCLSSCSCTFASDLYGVWYSDVQGIRNAIQFSENDNGDDVYAWAIYDIEENNIQSSVAGYYRISGKTIIFDPADESETFSLNFTFEGDKLILANESVRLELEKFVLEN